MHMSENNLVALDPRNIVLDGACYTVARNTRGEPVVLRLGGRSGAHGTQLRPAAPEAAQRVLAGVERQVVR
jgi:hypothetical protein